MTQSSFGWARPLALGALLLAACGGRSTRSDFTGATSAGGGVNEGAGATGGGGAVGGIGVIGGGAVGGTGALGGGAVGGTGAIGVGAVGGTGASVGGSGGVTVDVDACVVDGIRRTVGGNAGTGPAPSVACEYVNAFYCPGETYDIDSGPCEGSCTCSSAGRWSCDYVHPQPGGDCKVTSCVEGEITWDVGSSEVLEDGCTVCQCTSQGYLCTSAACEREALCAELEHEYADALPRATRCDPDTFVPQCTERFSVALGCENLDVPVNVTEELAGIAAKFRAHGCLSSGCPATTRVHGAVTCRPEGSCSDAP